MAVGEHLHARVRGCGPVRADRHRIRRIAAACQGLAGDWHSRRGRHSWYSAGCSRQVGWIESSCYGYEDTYVVDDDDGDDGG